MQPDSFFTGLGGLPSWLASAVGAAAAEIDERGEIPARLLAQLRDAGAYQLLTPTELGGFEVPLTSVLAVYEELGRLDASVAWIVWNGNWGFVGALLDPAGASQIWAGTEPGPVFANSGSPGAAVPAAGGYLLSGEWRLVSGINAADWVVVLAVVIEGGAPRRTEAGLPDVRLFAVPADQVTVAKTWNVSGMRATGSDDIRMDGGFVPEELAARFDVPARIDRPLYRGFVPALVLPGCSAIVLGIAAAAVEEVVRLAATKASLGGPRAYAAIAEAEADLRAARLLLLAAAETLQAAGDAGSAVTAGQRAALRAAMSHAARVSRRVLVSMYELGSSSALYTGNALERQFRDGMVALQHANHSAAAFEGAGRVRLGLDPGLPLF
jgi:alkylation response protein AidB-like acyl-CoA dehydrogenase